MDRKLTHADVGAAVEYIVSTMRKRFPRMVPSELNVTPLAWGAITVDGKVSANAAELYLTYGSEMFRFRTRDGVAAFSQRFMYEGELVQLAEELINLYRCELICSLSRP